MTGPTEASAQPKWHGMGWSGSPHQQTVCAGLQHTTGPGSSDGEIVPVANGLSIKSVLSLPSCSVSTPLEGWVLCHMYQAGKALTHESPPGTPHMLKLIPHNASNEADVIRAEPTHRGPGLSASVFWRPPGPFTQGSPGTSDASPRWCETSPCWGAAGHTLSMCELHSGEDANINAMKTSRRWASQAIRHPSSPAGHVLGCSNPPITAQRSSLRHSSHSVSSICTEPVLFSEMQTTLSFKVEESSIRSPFLPWRQTRSATLSAVNSVTCVWSSVSYWDLFTIDSSKQSVAPSHARLSGVPVASSICQTCQQPIHK